MILFWFSMFCVIIPPEEKLEDPESSFFYSYRQNRLGRIKKFYLVFGVVGSLSFGEFEEYLLVFVWNDEGASEGRKNAICDLGFD